VIFGLLIVGAPSGSDRDREEALDHGVDLVGYLKLVEVAGPNRDPDLQVSDHLPSGGNNTDCPSAQRRAPRRPGGGASSGGRR
jgi:hypothetical protein